MIVLPDTKETHDRIFIHLDKTTDCDGRRDRQTDSYHLAITGNSEHCDAL